MRLTSVVLQGEDVSAARTVLARLVEEAAADAALLVLRSGEIAVSHVESSIGSLEAFGALIAGNFASAREIARILGEQSFESLVQQGNGRQVATQAVGEGWLLVVIFKAASALGLVRLLAARAASELQPLNERALSQAGVTEAAAGGPGPQFGEAAGRAIDDLFRERK